MRGFTFDLHLVLRYYTSVLLLPLNFWDLKRKFYNTSCQKSKYINIWKHLLYGFSRSPPLINFLHITSEIVKLLWNGFVNQTWFTSFDLLGLVYMQIGILPVLFADWLLLSSNFTESFLQLLNTNEKIWEKVRTNVRQSTVEKLERSKSGKIKRLWYHTCFIDYMSFLNFGWATFGQPDKDPFMSYIIYPFSRGTLNDFVLWSLQNLNVVIVFSAWSVLLTLPAAIALNLECCLRGLEAVLDEGPFESYRAEDVLKDYRYIEYQIRELNKNKLSTSQWLFYMLSGAQQTNECYCIFYLIKLEAAWDDVQFMLLDISYTASRILHSFYALSTVDDATSGLMSKLQIPWKNTSVVANKAKRQYYKQLLCIRKTSIQMGPWNCEKDLPLSGMSVYLDNVVNAAITA